jgi:hypothetical protein
MLFTLFKNGGKLRYRVFNMLCVELKIIAMKCKKKKMVLTDEASCTVSLN